MKKIKLGVIFGGISTEHDVSVVSGTSVLEKLNKQKYDIKPIYIEKNGKWNEYTKDINEITGLKIGENIQDVKPIENVLEYIKGLDVVFPVLHGIGGEDGSIQGFFELLKIPYVGCGIISSSVGMDKVYTKTIFEKANINQARYVYIRKADDKYIYVDSEFNETDLQLEQICNKIEEQINYPMFVKPSNSGSSVGVKKANNKKELVENIEHACLFDNKILIEEEIQGTEIECAVLGNEEVISSCIGEIKSAEEFYSFDAKYKNTASKVIIPAEIDKEISNEIRDIAIKAFKAIDGKGLSRVDFFLEYKTNKIYINEINTMPGFTQISMYPKLFKQVGIEYPELLDKLIELALNRK